MVDDSLTNRNFLPCKRMKIAQFLCFAPHFSEDEMSAVHVMPELPTSNRRCRRRIIGSFFARHSRLQGNSCSASSPSSGRGCQLFNQRTFYESGTRSAPKTARKSFSDYDRGSGDTIFFSSSNSTPKASLSPSSSLSSPIFHSLESNEMAEAAAVKRWCFFCFLVVSLTVMVFCGRICAILWTASGLLLLPRRRPAPEKPKLSGPDMLSVAAQPKSPELRRKELIELDKRRVVLEGFLVRSKRA